MAGAAGFLCCPGMGLATDETGLAAGAGLRACPMGEVPVAGFSTALRAGGWGRAAAVGRFTGADAGMLEYGEPPFAGVPSSVERRAPCARG